ncbi:wHTH domain-containing protein [Streptomyces liangshanensis]|uniref:wHTH domain-containing protein n=1 Tax=Streptomyces liangshanensis TaxID=2717324 RepID=UPI0036DB6282
MYDAPDSQDPDDLKAASRELDGRGPWLNPARQAPYGHVLHAAAVLGHTPAGVAARLTALGYADIELAEAPLPGTVDPADVPLLRDVAARYSPTWLDVGKPVSLHQVVESAGRADRSPADVARRLTALGYRLGGTGRPLPETADRGDAVLISSGHGHYRTWADWGDEVPAYCVVESGGETRRGTYAAALRLVALGLRLPYTPDPSDEPLLRSAGEVVTGWHYRTPPVGHILEVARETGRTPADVAARLAELGHPAPPLPDTPEPDDPLLLSEELDGRAPWLGRDTTVGLPMRHVLRAALATGRTPADVAARLAVMGHRLHENAILPGTADEADVRLLATLDRSYLEQVHLEHVLRSAGLTGRSPADVAARLTALGHRLPDDVGLPDVRASVAP